MHKYLWLLPVFLSACSFTPHEVAIAPKPAPASHYMAGDKSVLLEVSDLRGEKGKVIGYWGKPEKTDAPITTRQDIAETTRQSLADKLSEMGFVIADKTVGAPLKLEVDLMTLSYANDYSDWKKIAARAQAGLYARVKNDNAVTYERDYIATDEDRYFIAPSVNENAKHINGALSKALSNLLSDGQLMMALGAVPAAPPTPEATPMSAPQPENPTPQVGTPSAPQEIIPAPLPAETAPLRSPTSL